MSLEATGSALEKRRAYQAAYRALHPDYMVTYRAAHREESRVYNAAWRSAHSEYFTTYRLIHREEQRAVSAAYHAAHREEKRRWRAAHAEKNREIRQRRRVRLRGGFVERVDLAVLVARDGGYCGICHKRVA